MHTVSMSFSSAFAHSGDHKKGVSFFRRVFSGFAIFAYLGIKGCWYPRTPKTEWSSLTFHGFLGQFLIAETLSESIVRPSDATLKPRKLTSCYLKRQFAGFKNKLFSLSILKKSAMICLCKSSSPSFVKIPQSSI